MTNGMHSMGDRWYAFHVRPLVYFPCVTTGMRSMIANSGDRGWRPKLEEKAGGQDWRPKLEDEAGGQSWRPKLVTMFATMFAVNGTDLCGRSGEPPV